MPRPISLFDPYLMINQAYGILRTLTVIRGFAPRNRAACINHYAVGFVRDIAADCLDRSKVDEIVAGYGGRGIWKSANHLLQFTPQLVEEVMSSKKLSEQEFAQRLTNEEAFLGFANQEQQMPGNRSKGHGI